jgi:hypothetical protein
MGLIIFHGLLFEVVGEARRAADGTWFVPACVEIDEPERNPSHWFRDHGGAGLPTDGGVELEGMDGVWVRAAIPGVFHYSPLYVSDGGGLLFDTVFFAVLLLDTESSGVAHPFACTDQGMGAGLVFSRLGPGVELRERIAKAFWGLLLTEGASRLSDFSLPRFEFETDDGDSPEVEVGYARGRFYCQEVHEQTVEEEEEEI